jgi:hypothetical protein
LEAKAAEEAKRSRGGGGAKQEKTDGASTKTSLAQAVAAARGQLQANPNGPAFYAGGDRETVKRVTTSDLPKYVKLRGQLNGTYTSSQLDSFRKRTAK